jgi:uncharacterized protein (TIGR02246 family)
MRALLAPLVLVAAAPLPGVQGQIMAAMEASAAGWNAGDLDRFMSVYADDAMYAAKAELLRGKTAIAARYRPGFVGTKNLRGRLSFQPLAFRTIGPAHQLLVARWTLSGGVKEEGGVTTLLWERRPAGWRIVSDHSS